MRPTMHTPHMCALAAESLTLQRSQVAMATCSPSRTALLTGRHATTTHVWDLFSCAPRRDPRPLTIPAILGSSQQALVPLLQTSAT